MNKVNKPLLLILNDIQRYQYLVLKQRSDNHVYAVLSLDVKGSKHNW